uniref:Glucosamine 6-phosphate N-acetyltransferase n=1 Tax=Catharus ustulatus TaxID=91951 RepID=A0A8C3VDM1_CATUS
MMPVATVMLDDTPMFDPRILQELDWSENTTTFSPAISPLDPGDGLVLRPLCTADLNRGFFKVLGQLTETGVVSPEQFIKTFEHMKRSGDYYVTVVEDTNLGQIVATATLVIEHKFTHSCAKRGRIEDVVVSGECRGKQLGKLFLHLSWQEFSLQAVLVLSHHPFCAAATCMVPRSSSSSCILFKLPAGGKRRLQPWQTRFQHFTLKFKLILHNKSPSHEFRIPV